MWAEIKRCGDGLLAVLLPSSCACCGGSVESLQDGVACSQCWKALSRPRVTCQRCGQPYPTETSVCELCRHYSFECARYCGTYDGALRACVLRLKTTPHLPKRLSRLLVETYRSEPRFAGSDLIVPVPLHATRLRERGFNQAELLAVELGAAVGLEVETTLERVQETARKRAMTSREQRREAMRGAFSVSSPRRVLGRQILLIDDLYTSGSTAQACAEALLNAGARSVSVLTLAKRL